MREDDRNIGLVSDPSRHVVLSGLTAFLIEEAREAGCAAFAEQLEAAMADLLKTVPVAQRKQALLLAFEVSALKTVPMPVTLRLVHSR